MNNKETKATIKFEKYLKSIGGLKNGIFTDVPPITSRYFFSIGDGWLNIVENLIKKCIKLGWDKKIAQCKEKFGELRFYINSATDSVHNAIIDAEKLSRKICEKCGKPGKQYCNKHGWYFTSCKKHKTKC